MKLFKKLFKKSFSMEFAKHTNNAIEANTNAIKSLNKAVYNILEINRFKSETINELEKRLEKLEQLEKSNV
jgi:hypothetical protein